MSIVKTFVTKPFHISAVHFTGGAEQATKIIDWATGLGGKARYYEGPVECIMLDLPTGDIAGCYVGQWIAHNPLNGAWWVETQEGLDGAYDQTENHEAELYVDEAGEWRYRVWAANGRQVGKAEEGFATKGSAKRAVRQRHPGVKFRETVNRATS